MDLPWISKDAVSCSRDLFDTKSCYDVSTHTARRAVSDTKERWISSYSEVVAKAICEDGPARSSALVENVWKSREVDAPLSHRSHVDDLELSTESEVESELITKGGH